VVRKRLGQLGGGDGRDAEPDVDEAAFAREERSLSEREVPIERAEPARTSSRSQG